MKKISFLFILILLSACERTTDNGEILKFYGDAKEDIGYSIALANDGYYIAGQLTQITRNGNQIVSSSPKPGIIKAGFDGNVIWKKFLGGRLEGSFSKVIVFENDSIAVAGQITDTLTNKTDIFLAILASDGTIARQNRIPKRIPASENQVSKDLLRTSNGFIILGTTDAERAVTSDSTGNNAGNTDLLFLRTNKNLNLIDTPVPLGFPGNDIGVTIKSDFGAGYIIAGTTDRYYSSKGQKNDLFLWKINAVGIATNPYIIGSTEDENAADMEVTDDGYIIAGTVINSASIDSILIKKIPLDLSPNPVFTLKYGSTTSWALNAISGYKSNSFVLAGTEGSSSLSRMLIFTIDAGGNLLYNQVKISGSSGIQASYDVVSDSENNIIAIGKNTFASNSLITLLKFRF
jgi:hypothetical protein